jgi:hypothetical protein
MLLRESRSHFVSGICCGRWHEGLVCTNTVLPCFDFLAQFFFYPPPLFNSLFRRITSHCEFQGWEMLSSSHCDFLPLARARAPEALSGAIMKKLLVALGAKSFGTQQLETFPPLPLVIIDPQ